MLQISDNVFKKLATMRQDIKKDNIILRISVEGGGCAGFQYKYEITEKVDQNDYIIDNNSIKIVVDDISLKFMQGCYVDYIEELGNSDFCISNPNISSKCGCNNSFSI